MMQQNSKLFQELLPQFLQGLALIDLIQTWTENQMLAILDSFGIIMA